jgi:hypothetical protein
MTTQWDEIDCLCAEGHWDIEYIQLYSWFILNHILYLYFVYQHFFILENISKSISTEECESGYT